MELFRKSLCCSQNRKYRGRTSRYFRYSSLIFSIIAVIGLIINIRFIISFMKNDLNKIEKIDWHDWKLIEAERKRVGLGEHGQGAYLSWYPESSKVINDTHGYNGYLSDKIALDRSLIDLRPPG